LLTKFHFGNILAIRYINGHEAYPGVQEDTLHLKPKDRQTMKTNISLEVAVKTYETLMSQRAFQEGYAAFMAGVERTAIPGRMNVYSGNWVEGWIAASQDAAAQPGAAKSMDDQTAFVGARIPLVRSAATVLSLRGLN
jgi:ribosome modulation factor